jgi:hypothetical protein
MLKSIIGAAALIGSFAFGQYTQHDLTPTPTPITVTPAATAAPDWVVTDACDNIDWRQTDGDGSPLIPFDANEDGYIDCQSDIELGS